MIIERVKLVYLCCRVSKECGLMHVTLLSVPRLCQFYHHPELSPHSHPQLLVLLGRCSLWAASPPPALRRWLSTHPTLPSSSSYTSSKTGVITSTHAMLLHARHRFHNMTHKQYLNDTVLLHTRHSPVSCKCLELRPNTCMQYQGPNTVHACTHARYLHSTILLHTRHMCHNMWHNCTAAYQAQVSQHAQHWILQL